MHITILIPTLNEEEGIGVTLDAVPVDTFREHGWTWDFLVVDGDSKDRTREEAEKRGARVIVDTRKGYGRAYKTGFDEAQGDVVVTADADGTYPLERAAEYVQRLQDDDLDFITCDRYADMRPGAMSRKHRLGNWVLSTTARTLFFVRLRDSQSGMWIVRRSALERLPYERFSDGMPFSQEIKIAALKHPRVRAVELPGGLHPRIGEAVIMSWRDGFGNLGRLFRRRLGRKWLGR